MSEDPRRDQAPARGFWAPVVRRLPRLERLVVYRAPVSDAGLDAVTTLGFDLREVSLADLELLEGVRRPHQVDPLRVLLRRRIRGWFAMMDGRFAGHAFLAVSRDRPERFGGIRLYPGEMAITSMFVAPAFRNRGLGGALHAQLVAIAARDYGSVTNIAWTADYNVASQRMLGKHGCTMVGTVDRLVFWHRPVLSLYRGAAPRR